MIQINNRKYCCFLTGNGTLEDQRNEELLEHDIPLWIQDQGDFEITKRGWEITVGISHENEEWRQDDDIKDFMINCYSFIDDLMSEGNGKLTLVLSYTKIRDSSCSINSSTSILLSSLKIDLEIYWNIKQD